MVFVKKRCFDGFHLFSPTGTRGPIAAAPAAWSDLSQPRVLADVDCCRLLIPFWGY